MVNTEIKQDMTYRLKGFTFRMLIRHYRIQGYVKNGLYRKINKALENAQIRAGELNRTPDKIIIP